MVDNQCQARDMVYGRCELKRRHKGEPHAIEIGTKRILWDSNGVRVEKIEPTLTIPLNSP